MVSRTGFLLLLAAKEMDDLYLEERKQMDLTGDLFKFQKINPWNSRCHLTCPWKTFALHLKSQVCLNRLIRRMSEVCMRLGCVFSPQQIFPSWSCQQKQDLKKWSSPFSPSLLDLFVSETAVVSLVGGKVSLYWKTKLFQNFTRFWLCASERSDLKRSVKRRQTNPSRAKKSKCRGGFCWTWSLIFQERGGYRRMVFFHISSLPNTVPCE